jgi:5-methylcytosine-specific restriction endonuclease McrA
MPSKGRAWNTNRAIHRAHARTTDERCWICGQPIDWTAPPRTPRSYSTDHHTPTSLGGGDALANLKTAHYGCNSSRGNTTRGEYPTSRKW